jgi:hypothetical protein
MKGALVGALLLSPASALALDKVDDGGDGSFAVLLGGDTAFDGNPATIRLTLQGEGDLVDGEMAGLAVVVPVTWMTTGEESFGISARHSVFELPPSLRLRLLNTLAVRPYADLGLGLVVASSEADSWVLEDREDNAGWMTRAAIGVEIGQTEGVYFVAEPLSAQTYHIGGDYARLGGMLGVGARF